MRILEFFRYFSAPIVGVIAIIVAVLNSKSYKLRQINRFALKKQMLDNQIIRKYGFHRSPIIITREDKMISHINDRIDMLKRSL